MCTLIVGFRLWPDLPLVVAANRDEDLDRPAAAPTARVIDDVRILAPTDLRAGGTWIGVNAFGVFVGLTNRFGLWPDASRASRGQLVISALTARSAAAAFAKLRALSPNAHNGFHLVLADRQDAFLITNDTTNLSAKSLPPGWHIVTERSFGAAATQREPLIRHAIAGQGPSIPPDQRLQEMLSMTAPDGFEGVLVNVPAHNYGTRSSTIIRLPNNEPLVFLHADGPPDVTPFRDYSALLRPGAPGA